MNIIISFTSGLIFSIGLIISGMVNPEKVIQFLDLFSQWDPSLIFVLGGATIVNLITFRQIAKKKKPLLAKTFSWPKKAQIDKKLLIGSTLFGIGWGITGLCPGTSIASIVLLDSKAITFILSMILGMLIFKLIESKT